MDFVQILIIILAGFAGGALNAIAGGGSFITLPALIYVGLPPITANATGTVALLPGYIASAWRYRGELGKAKEIPFKMYLVLSILGGSLGAVILLKTDNQVFNSIIPWLMLFASIVFALGSKLIKFPKDKGNQKVTNPASYLIIFLVCLYGGYFNGGLGIILLAALSLAGFTSFQMMNGVKSAISAVLTSIACVIYISSGIVNTQHIMTLAVASIFGGYTGAAFSYKLSAKTTRIVITTVGLIMTILFFLFS